MDSTMSNGEWSASEINIVKSLVARFNTNDSISGDMSKKHSDIINEIQTMFPIKEKYQVIRLYVDLMMEMMPSGTGDGSYHSATTSSDLVNNFEIPLENSTMDNMGMLLGRHPTMETWVMRVAQEVPRRQPTPRMERAHTRFWTKAEHRTTLQVSSHALKYFRRLENPTSRQRYSINDVSLYDAEPWAQNNTSNWERLSFAGGAYNPSLYGASGQHTTMNNQTQVQSPILYHANQASTSSQTAAWAGDQQIGATNSFTAPVMEEDGGSRAAWTGDQLGDFFHDEMMNMDMF
ncbi:hypothetical protein C2845_PM10G04060 [Panicum miliaceum]|uniref:HTH 3-helical bundle domain-containing protein n=1 Tax=Panicum miliaceum TaxID=4540 RepID=A0A3L6PF69_PANMI|nr:hypothetical protein C2845_PM10G04060 [Panicum miliaceum]